MKKYLYFILCTVLFINTFLLGCQKQIPAITQPVDEVTEPNEEDTSKNNESKEDEKLKEELEAKRKLEERVLLEEKRKAELREFYVPLIPIGDERERTVVEAKGLFVTAHTAAYSVDKENVSLYVSYIKALSENDTAKINELKSKIEKVNKFERIIATAVATEINTFVIDVKDDDGLVTYKSNIQLVSDIGANRVMPIKDINALLTLLKEYDIYPIARIVTFKDKNLANKMPEHSIQLKSGGVWKDYNGVSWVNPFDKYVWDYNVAIAKEAALLGFKEIQFDYVRFPAGAKYYNPITVFPGREDRDKDEAIEQFLNYANEQLKDYSVNVAADVFGVLTRSWDDKPEDIGQTWRKISRNVNIMSPMIYPSHYGPRWYGFDVPDAHPYGVLRGSLIEALERNASLKNPPVVRPWIQAFTAKWVKGYIPYGVKEIRDQIIAGKELGINEYLVWNASNTYDPLAYIESPDEKTKIENFIANKAKDEDIIGRTPDTAVKKYLSSEKRNITSKLYLLTPINKRSESYDVFDNEFDNSKHKLISYSVLDYSIIDENNAEVLLSYKYIIKENDKEFEVNNENVKWNVIKENNIWKVNKPEIKIESTTDNN